MNVRLSQLTYGSRLQSPIFDARPGQRTLLLASGKQLTPAAVESLRRRGIDSVLLHQSDWRRISTDKSAARPNATSVRNLRSNQTTIAQNSTTAEAKAGWEGWTVDADSFLHNLATPESLRRDPATGDEFQKSYDAAVIFTTSLLTLLVQEKRLNPEAAFRVSDQHLSEVKQDLDEFLHRGAAPILSDYPGRHSLQTAMLAVSMATLMGYRREDLLDLGCGCLLHDAGMLMVPTHILQMAGPMTAADRLELQKHPIYSINLLQERRDIPQTVRHVVYQMHERMNGSGYPRGRSANQIHPLARIAAVADAYLALISPRPFRAALLPYQAIERLLYSTRQGLFDSSAMRALLHSISLFPIGSSVILNDGRLANVVRANRDEFTRPTVEYTDLLNNSPAEMIDLRKTSDLFVIAFAEESNKQPRDPKATENLIAAANEL